MNDGKVTAPRAPMNLGLPVLISELASEPIAIVALVPLAIGALS
jgi:hypothetical protein